VSGSDDTTLIVWVTGDDGAFAAAQTLNGNTSAVLCVTQLEDRRLASTSDDNTLKVWEVNHRRSTVGQ
jgi:WD40 repeat protein